MLGSYPTGCGAVRNAFLHNIDASDLPAPLRLHRHHVQLPQAARQVVEAVKAAFRRQRQWFAVTQDARPTRAAQ